MAPKYRFRHSVILLILLLSAASGNAYEFSLSGNSTWSYVYYSQMGDTGFFGRYNADAVNTTNGYFPGVNPNAGVPILGAFASMNGWLGRTTNDLSSGSETSQNTMSVNFFPYLSINRAITMQGQFRIGSGLVDQYPGTNNTYGVGEFNVWSIAAENPLGRILYGKKPLVAGSGLQYDGSNRSEEMLDLTARFGPLNVGFGLYPSRAASSYYYNIADKNGIGAGELSGWFSYANGPVRFGAGTIYQSFNQGPESQRFQYFRDRFPPLNSQGTEGWLYFNYGNARFQFNTEADFVYRTNRYGASRLGTFFNTAQYAEAGSGSIFGTRYVESWRYMAQITSYAGPARMMLLYSYLPGPDRRHGVLIDRQPMTFDPQNRGTITFSRDLANVTLFRPVSFLLSTAYGAGVNALSLSNSGYMMDASVIAARLDYALAANLNTYVSFMTAKRVSHAYGWGYIRPGTSDLLTVDTTTAPVTTESGATGMVTYGIKGNFNNPSPAIPDNDLGWEVNAGIDWRLLEGMNVSMTAAYWQPGKWFNYACADKSVYDWSNVDPNPANPWDPAAWGIRPDRDIKGIFGLEMVLSTYF